MPSETTPRSSSVLTLLEGHAVGHLTPSPDGFRLAFTVEPEDPLYSGPILTISADDRRDRREVHVSERFVTGLT